MTKRNWILLGAAIVVVAITIIAIFAVRSCGQPPPVTPAPADDATSAAPKPTRVIRPAPEYVSVSINAVPWAEVFIKTPGSSRYVIPGTKFFNIKPKSNGKDAHVTPIRGKLKVPVGTAIKLVYDGRPKIFPYESWKTRRSISHDFLGQ